MIVVGVLYLSGMDGGACGIGVGWDGWVLVVMLA